MRATSYRLVRMIALGLIGYGIFAVAAFANGGADWRAGFVVAAIFAGSELLDLGPGRTGGVLRRIAVAGALMLFLCFVYMGMQPQEIRLKGTADPEPNLTSMGIFLLVYVVGLIVVKGGWMLIDAALHQSGRLYDA